MAIVSGNKLGMALEAEGLLPPKCSLVEVRIPASGPAQIIYTVNVQVEDLPKLARAMSSAAPEKVDA